jgi:dihydrofolate reductase
MIRHIVALDQKYGMAKNGGQPWNIPDDSQYFRDQTRSHGGQVLVGMTTFKTFDHPLSQRTNFVVTHQQEPIAGATLVHDLSRFFAETKGDIWVAGGASIFAQTMDVADELYVTRIEADFGCDQFYPQFDDEFTLSHQSELKEQNGFHYRYEIYTATHLKT